MNPRQPVQFCLESLLGEIPIDEFLDKYWDQAPFHCSRNDADFYSGLVSIDVIDEIISGTELRVPSLRIVKDGVELPPDQFTSSCWNRGSRISIFQSDLVFGAFHTGATVIFPSLDRYHYPIAEMCQMIRNSFGCVIQTNAYLTPPACGGFGAHWDNHNVLALQVSGSKRWRVWNDPVMQLPLLSDSCPPKLGELDGEYQEITLLQGDCLYIPRGFAHVTEAEDEPSLHLSISISICTFSDIIKGLVDLLQRDEIGLRKSVFLSKLADENIQDVLSKTFQRIGNKDLMQMCEELTQKTYLKQSRALVRGMLAAAQYAPSININTLVRRRPLLKFTLRVENGWLEVRFGGRMVQFPPSIAHALEMVISTDRPVTAVTLPIDCPLDEKLEIIKRMVLEGIMVV